MRPDQIELLRRLALSEKDAVQTIMGGPAEEVQVIDEHSAALVRIAVLLSVDADPQALRWAIDEGMAAGVDDNEVFDLLHVIAPIVGMGRLGAVLPHLMAGLDLEILGE